MGSMYDERVSNPALALMALGVPFCLLGVRWGLRTARLYGGPISGKMYQHRHTCRRLLSFSLGALDIAMAWEIYLLKPQAQHEWALLFSTSDLVYRSRHLLLAFPCFRLGPVSYLCNLPSP
jgi:hypothetical protein